MQSNRKSFSETVRPLVDMFRPCPSFWDRRLRRRFFTVFKQVCGAELLQNDYVYILYE